MAKNTLRKLFVPALAIFIVLFYSAGLLGYIDPGTGSYIFQVAVTLAAGAVFAVKVFWKNITGFFSGISGKKKKGK
jgi:quinol-cytochrome oxidoreductase complex cytochrome b subunit